MEMSSGRIGETVSIHVHKDLSPSVFRLDVVRVGSFLVRSQNLRYPIGGSVVIRSRDLTVARISSSSSIGTLILWEVPEHQSGTSSSISKLLPVSVYQMIRRQIHVPPRAPDPRCHSPSLKWFAALKALLT